MLTKHKTKRMKKQFLSALVAVLPIFGNTQVYVTDFENPTLQYADTAWFGQDQVIDGDTTFSSGILTFENNYNATWQSFSGWAYSNNIDVTTPGYSNQFSAITEGGANGTGQFGVCYVSGNKRAFIDGGAPMVISGAYFTNTTYTYLAMLNGDSFSKQFGDSTNANGTLDGTNGEDWLLLTIYGLNSDSLYTGDSVNFYLADYRFANNSLDYIISSWEYVDLSSLGAVYGLDFRLRSSDMGTWGMNTPAYFAMDELTIGTASLSAKTSFNFNFYPNPTNGHFQLELLPNSNVKILNSTGQILIENTTQSNITTYDLSLFSSGIYYSMVENNGNIITKKLVKQ